MIVRISNALGQVLVAAMLSAAVAADWETGDGYRARALELQPGGKPGFMVVDARMAGIQWTNHIALESYSERQNLMNGAGVALGDYDGDGRCDMFLCGKGGRSALLRNRGGWKFEDVTAAAGVGCEGLMATGAAFADINGDGRLDLLVTTFLGPALCFMNAGEGRFTNLPDHAGLNPKGGATSMALADLDGDGWLDLYQAYFGVEALLRDGANFSTRQVGGKTVVTGRYAKRLQIRDGRIMELGEPDIVYRNNRQGVFVPWNWPDIFLDEDGKPSGPPPDFGLCVQVRDLNEDGWPDIYVCNDFQTPDRIWLNDGAGRFRAAPRLALRNMSFASMGTDFGDLDRDGQIDFLTVEMYSREHKRRLRQMSPLHPVPRVPGSLEDREQFARNALYWNRGDGTFAEIAFYAGLAASDWSWSPVFLDVDLDGFEDVLISNGHMRDVNDRDSSATRTEQGGGLANAIAMMLRHPELMPLKAAYRNRGDLTFEDVASAWGFDSTRIAQGMAAADLDDDGDLDLVLNCAIGGPLLYRNLSPEGRVAVRLKGKAPNTQGIGALIRVRGKLPMQQQEVLAGGRYLSGDDAYRTFATGPAGAGVDIEVRWRAGARSLIRGAKPNTLYEVDEVAAQPTPAAPAIPTRPALFADATPALGHVHHEEAFDDFARQSMLPKLYSQLGPGVAWGDLNQDGHEDLVVGAGRGGTLGVFLSDGKGAFKRHEPNGLGGPLPDDTAGLAVVQGRDSQAALLVGMASYESEDPSAPSVKRYAFSQAGVAAAQGLPGNGSSTGPLAVGDVDGDGALDVFVAGRVVPGRFPEPPVSRVFRGVGGTFVLDERNTAAVANAGMVSAALLCDLNGDGRPELVLACEWGPVRIFRNADGWLQEATAETGMLGLTGLWSGLAAADLDGDGRLDLVAGNRGRNSYHNMAPLGRWQLVYGDFTGDGGVHLLEAYEEPATRTWAPWRDLTVLSKDWPELRTRFPTHREFSEASVASVLGAAAPSAKRLEAVTFNSVVLMNRGARFEPVPLPREAQWSPVFGIAVGDMDGDGAEDVVLGQNDFAVRMDDNRMDAGRALLLRGDGKGGMAAVPGRESGLLVYGEQRGVAVADYDEDGRPDLVVAQNGAATRLLHNVGARPGLRVKLRGPEGNPEGIGGILRVGVGEVWGPARLVRGAGGDGSQDASTQVMALPAGEARIQVRWPGGNSTTHTIPPGAREMRIDAGGEAKVLR